MFCGCTKFVTNYQNAECRGWKAGIESWHKQQADDEAKRESPNGWVTQPYSRENWDKHWNSVIYHVWKIGPGDCGGTYVGPYGPEIVRVIIDYRQQLGLPEVNLDASNLDKGL
jgi:hypothetical protein